MTTEPVKYKKPARINVVSVALVLASMLAALLAYQYVPLFLLEQEAYRVLEEHGSIFMGRKGLFAENDVERETLSMKMLTELRTIGIDDPKAEAWIELDGTEVSFGVAYTVWLEWPLDVIARHPKEFEVEHRVAMSGPASGAH